MLWSPWLRLAAISASNIMKFRQTVAAFAGNLHQSVFSNVTCPLETRAMREFGARREHPELKELVVEASRALARLDADRLEELALSCQALNRALVPANAEESAVLASQAREAAGEMAVFARVLEAT